MESVLWLTVLGTGLLVAVRSSRWAVGHLIDFAAATRIPSFIVGITLVSLGTDLPEIANSLVSSAAGHGDINVGDSIGSATVQSTLVLGLMPLIAGGFPLLVQPVLRVGAATAACLAGGALLMLDGNLSRLDAALLLTAWLAATVVAWHGNPDPEPGPPPEEARPGVRHLLPAALGLVLVGAGATTAVEALTQLATLWSVPEYLVAFLLASMGTSLPELTVVIAALREREWDLAVGDALGSSLLDATLSLAVGPLFFPIAVSTGAAVTGSVTAAAVIAIVVLVLTLRRRHDRASAALLIALFLAAYLVVGILG